MSTVPLDDATIAQLTVDTILVILFYDLPAPGLEMNHSKGQNSQINCKMVRFEWYQLLLIVNLSLFQFTIKLLIYIFNIKLHHTFSVSFERKNTP